jgi:Trk K+ transport system NAD-binding subunit
VSVLPSRLSEIELARRDRLIAYYILGLAGLAVAYALTYNYLLWTLEGVDQSIFASFEFVVQTMTTTGYGQDSGLWSHPVMFLFVAGAQLSGIAIGFFTLRLIIIPLFTDAEVNLDDRLTPKSDHVIICEYRRDSEVLLEELRELGIDYVLISSDEESARDLSDDGYSAIHGSPQDAEAFERASIDSARAVIADTGEANVNTVLTVRSVREDVELIALTDDSDLREVLQTTGADSVLSPHAVLGHRLAEKAVSSLSADLSDTIDLGPGMEVGEFSVPRGSRLVGQRVRQSRVREETGVTIIGAWIDGELQLPPDPNAVIRQNTVLVVSGTHAELEAFSEFARSTGPVSDHDRIVVAGYGEVGEAACSVIEATGLETTVIDETGGEHVDVVGDAATEETLQAADIESAGAIILGLPDDSSGLLATVLARSLNPDIEILTRVSDTDATEKALSAGADYVLSVPRVSARMVAKELRGEDVLAPASQMRLVRVPATPFAGQTLSESGVYQKTGCRVVAVETPDGQTTTADPNREFTGEERITIVGTDETVQQFLKQFDVTPSENGP